MNKPKYIFFVEGQKTEFNFIKIIFEKIYNRDYVEKNIKTDNSNSNYIFLESVDFEVYIKWISDADIVKFIKYYKEDEYSLGISLSDYYIKTEGLSIQFANEFLVIDTDLKDNLKGGRNKIHFLKDLEKTINALDGTNLILSTPMIECIIDE